MDCLDRKALEEMCSSRLKTPLFAIANPDDPVEHQIIKVIIFHRERGRERDVVRAAHEQCPADLIVASAFQKYVAATPAMV